MTAHMIRDLARFATLTTLLAAGLFTVAGLIPWALFTLLGLN